MITNENKILVKYLFPNLECLVFFKEQLFDELKEIIPEILCYSEDNKKEKNRNNNKNKCEDIITDFFTNNPIYKEEIELLYKNPLDEIIENILGGYVFILKNGVNVLKDKNSVCYIEGISFSKMIYN